MMASLLLSEGTPMIVAGDEVLRTQKGNNNAYCQDNATSWFDWRLVEKNAEMLRFTQALIDFRKAQPNVRRPYVPHRPGRGRRAAAGRELVRARRAGGELERAAAGAWCACWARPGSTTRRPATCMILLHAGGDSQEFVIPPAVRRLPWRLFVDTAAETPGRRLSRRSTARPLPPAAA